MSKVMPRLLEKIGSGKITVPSLPKVAGKIIELTAEEDISLKKLVEIIEKSQSTVVKLLKVANSTFYRGVKEINTIQGAITRLGLDLLKSVILNIFLLDVFKGKKDSSKIQKKVWQESFTMAFCARSLSRRTDHRNPEEAFTVGLVTHIGIMIMLSVVGKDYLELLREKFYRSKDLNILEREAYQTDHVEVGYFVLSRWNFPEIIKEVVKHHDSQQILSSSNDRLVELIKIIQVAEKIAGFFVSENPILNKDIIRLCRLFFDMNEKEVDGFLQHIQEEVNEAASLLDIDITLHKSYEQIYRSAIGKLADLNMSYDRQNKNLRQLEEEHKRAEAVLRESEERYRDLYENAPNAYFSINSADGSIFRCNCTALQLLGHEKENLMRLKFFDLYADTPHGLSKAKEVSRRFKAGESIRDIELQIKHKNGDLIWISLSVESVRDHDGNVTENRAMVIDISERKRLEAQLHQAQKIEALGTLAGGIAHNFNNLLMAIMGSASLMLLETDPTHPNYEMLKNIEKSVQNGSRLTRQLLGYARKGSYEIKPINLNQLVEETSDAFSMTKKEIRVHRKLCKDLLGIEADQVQIDQVLLNLYVNAADAMPRGGDLFLKTMNVTNKDMRGKPYKAKPGNYVLLTVRDTGAGMDKKTMERIFDPFFTTKGLARGTGLGLASVYGTVKGHGGYIDVESKKGHARPASEFRFPNSGIPENRKLA